MTRFTLFLALLMSATLPATAAVFTLTNGTTLRGDILSRTNGMLVLKDPVLGQVSIPETALQKKAVRKKGDLSRNASLFAGLETSHGNNNRLSLRLDTLFNRNRLWIDEWTLALSGRLLIEEGDLNERYGSAVLRYGRSFSKKIYGFVRTSLTHDHTGGVQSRLQPTAGAGYWFLESGSLTSFVELGAGWQWTDFTAIDNFSGGVLQLRFLLTWAPTTHFKIISDHHLFPHVNDPGSMRYEIATTISLGNSKKGTLTIKYDFYLDQNAPPGTKNSGGDLYLGFALAL